MLTYKKAGVDIVKADRFVDMIKPLADRTKRKEVLGGIGGFSGFFKPVLAGYKEPVLVSSTDGVGTKLLIAQLAGRYDTVGIDLVAMCVNDVVVTGAEPLFFLDYLAIPKVEPKNLYTMAKGIAAGCIQAGCALIGGETAELPGLYSKGKFDMAGFCVGIVDRKNIIDGSSVKAEDSIIGLASSGLHSNGFSLVRRAFSKKEQKRLANELLRPTRIYVKPVLKVLKNYKIKSMAHITGGGFYGNIPRVLPENLGARISKGSWPVPRIFGLLQKEAGIDDKEMFTVFNMGIGMAVVVAPQDARGLIRAFAKSGVKSWQIGRIIKKKGVMLV